MKEALDLLEKLTFDLLEAHKPELDDFHGGDSATPGEDPAGCSYCNDIDAARVFLEVNGRDVSNLNAEAV